MEKETIMIRKIKDGKITDKEDEVAIEYQMDIALKNGRKVSVTCTPAYLEEMILGRRFLLGDLTKKDLGIEETVPLTYAKLEDIFRIAERMFENPGALFKDTGCAHSCVLVMDGKVLFSVEDIGRHNALDKVIGYALKHQISIPKCVAFCSGRVSEDYLQKAIDAGFRIVVSRAAVTGSAVILAKKENITLLGFVRKGTGNIYHEGLVSLKE